MWESLRDALLRPDEERLATLAAAGPDAVVAFRDWLARDLVLDLPARLGREFLDDIGTVSLFLARRFPEAYVATFDDGRWRSTPWVLHGLGVTGSPVVKPLLIEVLGSQESEFVRLVAAIALRHLPGPDTVAALSRALDDPHYLVRYHAIESLGAVGDAAVLARLRPLTDSSNRGIATAAASAVRMLTERLGVEGDPRGER